MDRQRLQRIVRKALEQALGSAGAASELVAPSIRSGAPAVPTRPGPAAVESCDPGLVTEKDVLSARQQGWLVVRSGAIVTPAARESAERHRVELRRRPPSSALSSGSTTIALGADHGGFEVKQRIARLLERQGVTVLDVGTHSSDPVDYPDIAHDVARAVAAGRCRAGILVDGAGVGSCMAANKVAGIRAANPMSVDSAINSRRHNDANVLCLGSRMLPFEALRAILEVWLREPFEGGRHAKRVAKIEAGS